VFCPVPFPLPPVPYRPQKDFPWTWDEPHYKLDRFGMHAPANARCSLLVAPANARCRLVIAQYAPANARCSLVIAQSISTCQCKVQSSNSTVY
jgi:hypothetical protein